MSRNGPGRHPSEFIRSNWRELTDLPEPDETWYSSDQSDWVFHHLDGMADLGIVEAVGRDPEVNGSDARKLWQTAPAAKEFIDEVAAAAADRDRQNPCDCHGFGFSHGEDGTIRCKWCDAEWPADEFRALVDDRQSGGAANAD